MMWLASDYGRPESHGPGAPLPVRAYAAIVVRESVRRRARRTVKVRSMMSSISHRGRPAPLAIVDEEAGAALWRWRSSSALVSSVASGLCIGGLAVRPQGDAMDLRTRRVEETREETESHARGRKKREGKRTACGRGTVRAQSQTQRDRARWGKLQMMSCYSTSRVFTHDKGSYATLSREGKRMGGYAEEN